MIIKIETQFEKIDDFEMGVKDELQITEDDKYYYSDVNFSDKKSARQYLKKLINNGIRVGQDYYDIMYGYLLIVNAAIDFVDSSDDKDYTFKRDDETWIRVWKFK